MTNIEKIIVENQKVETEVESAGGENASDQNTEKSNIGAVDLLNLPKVDLHPNHETLNE